MLFAEFVDTVDTAEGKDKDLRIRCDRGLRTRFREFVAARDFPNYERALNWLLDHAPGESRAPIRSYNVGSPIMQAPRGR